jgi:hypothetical protein
VAWKADFFHPKRGSTANGGSDDLFVNKATPLVSYCAGAPYCIEATRGAAIEPASFLAGWSNHAESATAASRIGWEEAV